MRIHYSCYNNYVHHMLQEDVSVCLLVLFFSVYQHEGVYQSFGSQRKSPSIQRKCFNTGVHVCTNIKLCMYVCNHTHDGEGCPVCSTFVCTYICRVIHTVYPSTLIVTVHIQLNTYLPTTGYAVHQCTYTHNLSTMKKNQLL